MTLVLIVIILLFLLGACEKPTEEPIVEPIQEPIQQNKKLNNIKENEELLNNNDAISIEEAEETPSISPNIIPIKDYCDNTNWKISSEILSQGMYSYGKPFISASASSYLESEGNDTYYANKSHDVDLSTAWVEGAAGNGIGERIVYTINPVLNNRITHVDILNGFMKSDYFWEANSRIKKLRVWLDGDIYAVLMLEDSKEMQRFNINPIELNEEKKLEFEILEIYKGSKYDDVAITEIQFCSNSNNINEPKILDQGRYNVTMIQEDGTSGFCKEIKQDNIILNYAFTKPANRQSVEDAFEKCNSDFLDINISYKWISDYNLEIKLSNLAKGNYKIELMSAKDLKNFDFMLLSEMWGQSEFSYYGRENTIKTIDIMTKEIVDRTDIVFPSYFMYPKSISPYSDNFYYEYYNSIDVRFFIPNIYDSSLGWVELINEDNAELYCSFEYEQVYWLSDDLVYIHNDIYNIDGSLVKSLDSDGEIVGIIPFVDGSQVMVLISGLAEHLKVLILDSSFNEIINTIDLPFNCLITNECNESHYHDIEYVWVNDQTLIIEGWNLDEEGSIRRQAPSIYELNIDDYSSSLIKSSARIESYLGDNKLLILDYSEAEINIYYDYLNSGQNQIGLLNIFNLENNELTLIDMLNEVDKDIKYTYKNYVIYTDKNKLYFYDYINQSQSYILFESFVYILGEKDGLLYLDVQG